MLKSSENSRCVRLQIIINILPKIGQNSIQVSRINSVSTTNQLIHLMYFESLKTNLRSPSWDLHWHDFRSPTGASVSSISFCRDFGVAAGWGMFLCVLLVWAMERPGEVEQHPGMLMSNGVSWIFPSHVSIQCRKVHCCGWALTSTLLESQDQVTLPRMVP